MINTAIAIVCIICATVVVLFVIGCIHDYLKATQDARNMARFEKAFREFKEYNEINKGGIVNPTPTTTAGAANPADELDFPNSRIDELKNRYK